MPRPLVVFGRRSNLFFGEQEDGLARLGVAELFAGQLLNDVGVGLEGFDFRNECGVGGFKLGDFLDQLRVLGAAAADLEPASVTEGGADQDGQSRGGGDEDDDAASDG